MRKIKLRLSVLLCFWAIGLQAQSEFLNLILSAHPEPSRRILILSSHHLSHAWTHDVRDHIEAAFGAEGANYRIDSVELTSVRGSPLPEEAAVSLLKELFDSQGTEGKYDVMVSILGKAMDFLTLHYDLFPKGLPIVVCGCQASPFFPSETYPNITFIQSGPIIWDNIRLGKKLMPSAQGVLVISEGENLKNSLQSQWEAYHREFPGCRIRILNGMDTTTDEMIEAAATLPENAFIVLSSWRRAERDGYLNFRSVLDKIKEHTSAPILIARNDYMVPGILGGYVMDSTLYGEEVVSLIKEILANPPDAPLPSRDRPLRCIINDTALRSFGFAESALPKEAVMLNQVPPLWQLYKKEMILGTGLFLLFLFLVVQLALAHRKLKRESLKTERILSALPIRIVITNREGKILFHQFEKGYHWGWGAPQHLDELRGLDIRRIKELAEQVFREEKGLAYPYTFEGKNRLMHLQLMDPEVFGEEAVFWFSQDVTELAQERSRRRELEERSRIILESVGDGLIATDHEGKIAYLNPVASALSGYTQEEASYFKEKDLETLRLGKPYNYLEKLGDSWIQMSKSAFRATDGRTLLIGFATDVTELHRLQEKEGESRLLFESILNHSPIGISAKDVDNDFRYFAWGKRLEQATGIPASKVIGKTDYEIFGDEAAEEVRNWDLRAMETGETQAYLHFFGDEDILTFRTFKTFVKTESGRRLIISADLDETRRLDLEDERLQLLGELNQHIESSQVINRCLESAISGEDFNQVVEEMLELLGHRLKACRTYLVKFDADKNLVTKTHEWEGRSAAPATEMLRDISLALEQSDEFYQKLLRGEDIVIEDTESPAVPGAERWKKFWLEERSVKSLIIIGVWQNDQLWGFLQTEFTFIKQKFTENDIRLLHDVVSVLNLAQERFRMLSDLQKYIRNARVVNRCLQKVAVATDFAGAIEDVMGILARSLRADNCRVMRFEEDYAYSRTTHNWLGRNIPAEKRADWALERVPAALKITERHKEYMYTVYSGMENIPEYSEGSKPYFRKLGIESIFHVGIWIDRKLWGEIGFAFLEKRNFTRSEINMMSSAVHIFQLAYERNRQMEALAESNHLRRQVFDHIDAPMVMVDRERKIVIATASFSKLLGVPHEKLIGAKCRDYFCHDKHNRSRSLETCQSKSCPVRTAFAQNIKVTRSIEFEGRFYQVCVQPIFDLHGELLYVLESLTDITDIHENQVRLEKAMEAAQAASRAKSVFLSTMSHEIRTPLNAIIGFSEVLQDSDIKPEEEKDYLKSIHLSSGTLLTLVNNVLDLSKIEADTTEFVPVRTDIAALLKEIHSIFRGKADEKGLDFRFSYPEQLPLFLLDPARVKQILLNLVGNALKFTHEGDVRVQLEFEPADAKTCLLTFVVSDTGIGIAEEFQKDIFEPFNRQQDMTKKGHYYEGSGLGLSITKKLVEKMGGEIFFTSRPGEGSTFTVRFPNISYEYPIETEKSNQVPADEQVIDRGIRVLLVDDVEMNLKVLSIMLGKMNVEHTLASSGKQALEEFEKGDFNVILTDMWMPEMNGEELARAIRATPKGENVKIYAITADIEAETGFDLTHLDGILYKPVGREKLLKLLSGVKV